MIDYDNKNAHMLMTCDTCGYDAEFNGDFGFCVAQAKEDGWIVFKKKGEFHHYCKPECKEAL